MLKADSCCFFLVYMPGCALARRICIYATDIVKNTALKGSVNNRFHTFRVLGCDLRTKLVLEDVSNGNTSV